MATNFEFKFIGNQGFGFKADHRPYYSKELEIEFPDNSKLMFQTASNNYPPIIYRSNIDDYNSSILADLNEWGINNSPIIYLPFENLIVDCDLYPGLYKDAEGNDSSFSYTTVPSGIYKVRTKLVHPNGTEIYNESDYFITTESTNQCIAEKVDEVQQFSCTDCKEYDEAIKLTTTMLMIRDAALWDYSKGYIEEANNKFSALDNVCESGVLNYITGC